MRKSIPRVLLVRHGKRPSDPGFDTHLTEEGLAQADNIPQLLQDYTVLRIYSSPYLRCLETALPLATALDQTIYADYGLSECFEPDDPHPSPRELTPDEHTVYRVDPTYTSSCAASSIPEGEGWDTLHHRITHFLVSMDPHTSMCNNVKNPVIVVFTHMTPLNCLLDVTGHPRGPETPFPMGGITSLDKGPTQVLFSSPSSSGNGLPPCNLDS